MGKKLLKTFTNNIGFKILAIAFAFILWLVVYNLNDPVKTKTFTTTVTVTGRDSVVDKGLWPTIKDSEKTISFSVSGKRSYLNELDDSDFYANVDLANIIVDKDDTNKASVKVDIGCTKYRHSITFNGGDHMLPLSVEKYMQKQFEVKVSVVGSLSGAKALGNKPQANPKVVKIGGPESVVSTIASANVNIKVDDNTIISDNQITDRGDLTLIDDNGDEIDISKLDVDSQYQSIAVTVDVLSTKEVPIKCTTTGSPAGGKSVLGVELSEESVMLKGNAEALNNITSIDVGPIDISGATDDISTSVDLTGYLPDGVFIVNSYKTKLSIDIKVETNATSTMTLNSSNITYDGLEDGYTLTFVTDKSSVVVSGTQSDIDTLSGTTLKGKIDVTGLDAGTHTVTVKPNLDETKYTWGEIKVQIVIGRKGDGGGTTGTDGTGRKNAHEKLLQEFEESGDLLIGTQMVAKGLDFERVTLVGILNADATLCRNDYRASETAYEMLEQASGRSGRGKLKGQVMIQTFDPDHFVMRCVQMHDYKMFFNQEMRYRHLGMYPPYVYLCTLVFTHFDLQEAYKMARVAKSYFTSLRVLGPIEIRMQQKKHRVRLILKSKDDQLLHKLVRNYLDETKQVVDVNMHPIMMEE